MHDYILGPLERKINLFPPQKRAIDYILKQKYCINASEPGTGKTPMALDLIYRTKLPAIIVCPAFLATTWLLEVEKFYSGMKAEIYIKQTSMDCDIVICSYERMQRIELAFKQSPIWIFDEAHYLTNPDAKRTKFVYKMLNKYRPEYFVLASGTPIKNRIIEYWSLLGMLSHLRKNSFLDKFPNRWRFADYFSFRKETAFGVEYTGIQHTEQLNKILDQQTFKVFLSEVMHLPGISNSVVKFKDEFINADFENRLQEAYFGGHISSIKCKAALAKVDFTAQYILNAKKSMTEPILCFSDHVETLQELNAKVGKQLITRVITGDTPMARRQQYKEDFQAGLIDVLFLSIKAAGVGLTLTRATLSVFNDLSWVPAENEQALARFYRIGQTKACRYVFIAREGVDNRITESLREKMEVIRATDRRSLDANAKEIEYAITFL